MSALQQALLCYWGGRKRGKSDAFPSPQPKQAKRAQ